MSDSMFRVKGYVVSVDEKSYGNSGKSMMEVMLEIDPPEWQKGGTKQQLPIAVFGKTKDAVSKFRPGDFAELKGRVGSREYKDRWYLSLSLEDVLEHIPTQPRPMPPADDAPF